MLNLFTKQAASIKPQNVMFKRIEKMWDIIQTIPEIPVARRESRVLALRHGKQYCNLCYKTDLGNVNVAIDKCYTYELEKKIFKGYKVTYCNIGKKRPSYVYCMDAAGSWLDRGYLYISEVFSLDVTPNSLEVHPQMRAGEILAKDIDLAILEAEEILVPLQIQNTFHHMQVQLLMDGV